MKTEYKTFQFSLLAMAPIHIGNGEKYTSREFIYENGHFYFPDMGKFYNRMVGKDTIKSLSVFYRRQSQTPEIIV